MILTSAAQAILPKIKDVKVPLRRELQGLGAMAKTRANEIKTGLNIGSVRTAPMAKKASSASITAPGGGGAGPVPCLEGFGAEIQREVSKRVTELKARLKPGDIINTDPRAPRGPDRMFKAISKRVQGTRFGHSALYDGKGNVIEARGHTVIKRPLADLARCNQLVAVAPKGVSNADRARAVAWLNSHVGNDAMRVTLGNLVAHGIKPTALSRAHEGVKQQIDRALCSSLIANAYAKVPFNPKRQIADQRPVDLLHSDHVKVVGKVS